MKDFHITLETGKLAKEKGFYSDIPPVKCTAKETLTNGEEVEWFLKTDGDSRHRNPIMCPTQDILHKWLREEHGMHVIVIPTVTSAWTFKTVTVLSKRDDDIIMGIKDVSEVPPYKKVNGFDYSTYEEALEEGLKQSLKQIEVTNGN